MKNLGLLLLSTILSINTYSEHIIGGDFTVQHVEGNTFQAILTLYRDCGSEGAPFDPTVDVTVFDNVTNEQINELNFTFTGFESFEAELGNSCFTPAICMEIGTYETEFTLDNNPNGY